MRPREWKRNSERRNTKMKSRVRELTHMTYRKGLLYKVTTAPCSKTPSVDEGRESQRDQKFNAILGYIVNLRSTDVHKILPPNKEEERVEGRRGGVVEREVHP